MRSLGRVDLSTYVRAVPLLLRNPSIALAPLLAAVAQILLFMLLPADAGSGFLGAANSSISGLVAQLITGFGFGVALIVAEAAWRRGRAPFDTAWEEAQRKAGGILLATIGLGFIVYVAGLVGSILPGFGSIFLVLIAYFFFIYTIPAAAIGGFPGSAALQASLETARRAPLATLIVMVVYVFTFAYLPTLVVDLLQPLLLGTSIFASGVVSSLLVAAVKAVVTGYVALVLAKTYDDASYGRY
ncbi:MAG: hypothetical protein IAI50_16900 [Candidatus Eremiobacteraeota bacterium]|nr:hypothetical protein [Candidatus Eremiobacteraeota bacterium]